VAGFHGRPYAFDEKLGACGALAVELERMPLDTGFLGLGLGDDQELKVHVLAR
jgi:hypothetical protein